MKNFFRSRAAVVVMIATVIILVLAIVGASTAGRASPVSNVVGVLMTPFRSAADGIGRFFGGIYSRFYEYAELESENAALRRRIADMEASVRESEKALEENARLRSLLGLAERKRDLEFVMCGVVSRDSGDWASTLTISKGSANGIECFDCVVDEEGNLVGQVTELGTNWATVTTLVDSSFELGAVIARSGVAAVAEGDFGLMAKGCLKLTYLPAAAVILNGDTVLTSGVGGVFPSDLVIGTVEELESDYSGTGSYAVIRPATELDELVQVFVVSSFEISE